MPEWRYGDAGDKIPIERRDILRVDDSHVMACGDAEKQHGQALADHYGSIDIAYVDLPYNEGMAKSYRTKADLDNTVDYTEFLDSVSMALARVEGQVFVETGRGPPADAAVESLRKHGARDINRYTITYYGENPATLLQTSFTDPVRYNERFVGLDDTETPRVALEDHSEPGDRILDPCCGRGLTPDTADDLGRESVCLELHPRRLAVAVERLVERRCGGDYTREDLKELIERVGRLPE